MTPARRRQPVEATTAAAEDQEADIQFTPQTLKDGLIKYQCQFWFQNKKRMSADDPLCQKSQLWRNSIVVPDKNGVLATGTSSNKPTNPIGVPLFTVIPFKEESQPATAILASVRDRFLRAIEAAPEVYIEAKALMDVDLQALGLDELLIDKLAINEKMRLLGKKRLLTALADAEIRALGLDMALELSGEDLAFREKFKMLTENLLRAHYPKEPASPVGSNRPEIHMIRLNTHSNMVITSHFVDIMEGASLEKFYSWLDSVAEPFRHVGLRDWRILDMMDRHILYEKTCVPHDKEAALQESAEYFRREKELEEQFLGWSYALSKWNESGPELVHSDWYDWHALEGDVQPDDLVTTSKEPRLRLFFMRTWELLQARAMGPGISMGRAFFLPQD